MIKKECGGVYGERFLAVENGLMRLEQARYYQAWHQVLGDQRRVLDNAMGPNLSSDLFLTNAEEIVAVDAKGFSNVYSHRYAEDYWDLVDRKPIYRAGALEYSWGETAEGLELPDKEWNLFRDHCEDRYRRGYWDIGAINRWDIDRLLFLEMKKLGVMRESIVIQKPSDYETEISFEWAYPGGGLRQRKLTYLSGTIDRLLTTSAARLMGKIDLFMQKGLETKCTADYLKMIIPRMSSDAVCAIGYVFGSDEYNRELSEELELAVGSRFARMELAAEIDKMIDDLPDEDGRGDIKRGIKLHVFRRKAGVG